MPTQIDQSKSQIELYAENGQVWIDARGSDWFAMTPEEARRFAAAVERMASNLMRKVG